ncbi:penicillin-binding protein 1C [Lutibacter sp. TH_r2]|uniref:penicillin-binding protein 1C n=1 Tax=Lutibacter sp. TH_r2 TaxID=3082083 RepID=UPI002954C808|nr:penicillin-binding protein 1C [Lutibacter sp. TH_r2]MDV7186518.1 penicillin-binding protein 1C [Lutibacter sp. TH_r2]
MKFFKTHKIKLIIAVILLTAYYFSLPKQLFKSPTSTVIESAEGELLGAKIAEDGQWRFPQNDSIPTKFKQCIVQFEDAYFYKHPGFNPISIFKALSENLKSKKVKRGGSTITQQVIRLSRKNQKRTYFEKLKELILATRLELRYSKEKILSLYASNAPFGGNVVGLDVASWRYFGRYSNDLSWAESATLAVLPNAPSLIYPGKNQQKLLQKRNRLLKKLFEEDIIDKLTYELALEEELPQKPYAIPQIAPHLLQKVAKEFKGKRVETSVEIGLQHNINEIVKTHYNELSQNEIYNIAVLVLNVETRQVLAYVGNSPTSKQHHKDVDIIDKPRSTGSILKPFLYAAMLDAGDLLPNTLVADVPTQFASYKPENFDKKFSGAVSASKALSRSLNVPAVRMLQSFGLDRFHHYLKELKLTDIKYNANHYGLSLILGGAESNLWDLSKSYASMASTINHYDDTQGKYYKNEFLEPSYLKNFKPNFGETSTEKTIFDAGSTYLTFESLNKVNRPEGEQNWEFFNDANKIAWKTGTSFGFRDAWAIGATKKYVVGVWVGNADGEGRPGLVGVTAAAPILFDVFNYLPQNSWFEKPFDELVKVPICSKSGYRASEICEQKDSVFVQRAGLKTKPCPYHLWVHLDKNEEFQVNTSCETLDNMVHKSWFVLPPLMEHYFKNSNPFYRTLPSFRSDCLNESKAKMEFVTPKKNETFYMAKDFNENQLPIVFKLVHSNSEVKVFWYLNKQYIGVTQSIHEIEVLPKKGKFILTAIDEFGRELNSLFEIKD